MRKIGLKIALFTILMLIYIKLTYRQLLCNTRLKHKKLSNIPLDIENNMISMLFFNKNLL